MLPNDLREITEEQLLALVNNQVSESRSLEYKLALPGNSDEERREFLADISSFANTVGGDVLYGIRSENGIAAEIVGVSVPDCDAEVLRLESLLASSLQPRVSNQIHPVPVTGGHVFVIRVRQSLLAPHRVIFRGHDKFYGRNSAGKFTMDVEQLRTSFLQASSVTDKIRDFHATRVLEIEAGRAPEPLWGQNKIILHLVPLASFSSQLNLSKEQFASIETDNALTRPMHTTGWNPPRANLLGWVANAGRQENTTRSYLQIFRNGGIESVESTILDRDGSNLIPSYTLEEQIIEHTEQCLNLLRQLGIDTPVYVFITLTGVEGLSMGYDTSRRFREQDNPIPQDVLNLPETVFETYTQGVASTLHPALDLVWNACGMAGSINFDEAGNWINH